MESVKKRAKKTGSAHAGDGMDELAEKLSLKIQPRLHQWPFVGDDFPINVYLTDEQENLKCGMAVPLEVQLFYEEFPPVAVPNGDEILKISGASADVCINSNGMAKFKVRINDVCMAHGNKKFAIQVRAKQGNNPFSQNIFPVMSTGMTVIKHRLVLQDRPPDLWYKDEGGRDKCIALGVHLEDEKGNCVQGRKVHLGGAKHLT